MILGSAILAATVVGGMPAGVLSLSFVELSASIDAQFSVSSSLNVVAFVPAMGMVHFPTLQDTTGNLLQASNNARAHLAAAIDASQLSLTLTGDLSQFKTSGALTIDIPLIAARTATSSEIVYYNGVSGQVITLADRGQDGTTAKSFASGSVVEARAVARHHDIHSEAIIALEVASFAQDTAIAAVATDIDGVAATVSDRVLKAGDTMTGDLILAGPPAVALQAATKAYVDAISVGVFNEPGVYRPESYGASGSAVTTTGSISSGTNQLIVASASTFAVGQGIRVVGAGVAGGWLVTSIASIAGTTFLLANNASTTAAAALVTHDDTVAIQTALTAAWNDGAGTVKFASPSFYRVNGPVQSATNSILTIPDTGSFYTSKPRTIRLLGSDWNIGGPFGLAPTLGCIIQSDRIGTTNESSIFAAKLWNANLINDLSLTNQTAIVMTGLTWRTYDNPNISCVDLGMAYNCIIRECMFDTGMSLVGNYVTGATPLIEGVSEPTHNTFGLRLCRFGTIIQTDGVSVAGYATNIFAGDLWTSVSTYSVVGKTAVYVYAPSNYPMYGRLMIIQCRRGIHFEGETGIDMHLDYEVDPRTTPTPRFPAWWQNQPNEYLYDPTNTAYGRVQYAREDGYIVGRGIPITVTGTTRIVKTQLW